MLSNLRNISIFAVLLIAPVSTLFGCTPTSENNVPRAGIIDAAKAGIIDAAKAGIIDAAKAGINVTTSGIIAKLARDQIDTNVIQNLFNELDVDKDQKIDLKEMDGEKIHQRPNPYHFGNKASKNISSNPYVFGNKASENIIILGPIDMISKLFECEKEEAIERGKEEAIHTKMELQRKLKTLTQSKQLHNFLAQYDLDGDSKLCYSEFKKAFYSGFEINKPQWAKALLYFWW